jgi:GYF domain 2
VSALSHSSDPKSPRFFYSIDGEEFGPVSAADLRCLASAGRISPSDVIWKEGTDRRLPAAKVKGLFPEPQVSSTPVSAKDPHQTSTRRPPERSSAATEPTEPPEHLPLIRVAYHPDVFHRPLLGLFHGHQIVGVFRDRLEVARSVRYPRLDEEECTDQGLTDRLASSAFFERIPFSTVSSAAFHGQAKRSFRGKLYPSSEVELRVRTESGSTRLRFHRREVSNVYAALQKGLKERLDPSVHWRGPGPGLIVCFFLALALFVLFFVLEVVLCDTFLPSRSTLEHLGAFIDFAIWIVPFGLAFVVVYLIRKWFRRDHTKRLPFECLSALKWPPPSGTGSGVRQPYRSRVAGVTLKIIAFAWLLVIVLYIPRRVHQYEISDQNQRLMLTFLLPTGIALLSVPSVVLLYLGHGIARAAKTAVQRTGTARHILFLRSFSLDGMTTLQPDTILAATLGVSGAGSVKAWFSGVLSGVNLFVNFKFLQCVHPARLTRLFLGIVADSTEQSLVRYFDQIGPVLAIGKPGERIAQTGALREYVADDEWHGVVLSRLRDCQAVVIQPSQSAGMRWELETVCTSMPREKILFVLGVGPGSSNDYEELKELIEPMLNARLPRCLPFVGLPVAMWFDRDGPVRWTEISYRSPAAWLFTGDAVDLEYTLRPFVQGIHGGDRELPRPVREHRRLNYAVAWLVVVGWFVGFGLWLNQGQSISFQPTYAESNYKTVIGTALPYAVEIPESWTPRIVSEVSLEYEFVKPGVGLIKILAHSGREDLSRLPEQMIANTKAGKMGMLVRDVIAQDVQSRMIGDRSCIEFKLKNELRIGLNEFQRIVAYTGDDGTFLINVVATADIAPAQLTEIDHVLGSVRFSKSLSEIQVDNRMAAVRRFREAVEPEIRVLRGKTVRYELRVPRAWTSVESTEQIIEHTYKTLSGGVFVVLADPGKEDLSNIEDVIAVRHRVCRRSGCTPAFCQNGQPTAQILPRLHAVPPVTAVSSKSRYWPRS